MVGNSLGTLKVKERGDEVARLCQLQFIAINNWGKAVAQKIVVCRYAPKH